MCGSCETGRDSEVPRPNKNVISAGGGAMCRLKTLTQNETYSTLTTPRLAYPARRVAGRAYPKRQNTLRGPGRQVTEPVC